jgi:hypothetical protein
VSALSGRGVPASVVHNAKQQLGDALQAATHLPAAAGRSFVILAKSAFLDGFQAGTYVGAAVVALGVLVVLKWLPARARVEDVDRQDAEYNAEWAAAGVPADGDGAAADGQRPGEPARPPTPARSP